MTGKEENAETGSKMVSVSEDYLAFLHDELSENYVRLRDLLGDSQTRAILSFSSDRLVTTVEAGRYTFDPIDGIVEKLSSWGMKVSTKARGNSVELEVKCPYAERIHPRLTSKEPRCPLGEYILGAIRLEDSKSQLVGNHLTRDGVRLAIEKPVDRLWDLPEPSIAQPTEPADEAKRTIQEPEKGISSPTLNTENVRYRSRST